MATLTDDTSSLTLLALAQQGDGRALDLLVGRYLPRLRRWAHGRVPAAVRDLADTDDVVQDTLIRTIRNLGTFVPLTEAGLIAYLREALWNRVRDEVRRSHARPERLPLGSDLRTTTPSPLEAAVGAERMARYDKALERLPPDQREAIVARFELGYSFPQLAAIFGKPSPDAARKAVHRALVALLALMNHGST